jgi:hypothetical protein
VPFLPKYDFDIFISYAHADGREWVDRYCAEFAAELHRRLPGRDKPEIFLDKHDLRAGDNVDSVIADGIKRSALFLAFISPQYEASPPCMRGELEAFQDLHGPASDRIFQVIRVPIEGKPPVPESLWVQADEKSRLVEGLAARLIRLRRELVQLYIAWPGKAAEKDRTRIESEFKAQRFVIRPNRAFNKNAQEEDIRSELADSDLSIHLFSPEPDDLAERQFKIARELEKPALVVTRNPEEPRRPHRDPSPAVYLDDPNAMSHLIDLVNGHLGPRRVPPADSARRVLLLYKPDQDWRCADDLTQMLRDRGAEVVTPSDPYPDPFLNLDAHVDDLRQSAGVVVCWGDASDEWLDGVDRKLSVLRMRDSQVGQLTRAKYFVEPPAKQRPPGRNEFIIRQEADLPPFLKAAGVGR